MHDTRDKEFVELDRELNGWRSDLLLGAHKQPKPVVENALIALRSCPEWDGVLAYDEFAVTTMAVHPPPWLQRLHNKWEPRRWTDDDDVRTTAWLQRNDICINSLRSVGCRFDCSA